MPEQIEQIEVLRYQLSEAESHLENVKIQLQSILNDISVLEIQVENYKSQIAELENNESE